MGCTLQDWCSLQPATNVGDPTDYGICAVGDGSLGIRRGLESAGYGEAVIQKVDQAAQQTNREGRTVIDLYSRSGSKSADVAINDGVIQVEVRPKKTMFTVDAARGMFPNALPLMPCRQYQISNHKHLSTFFIFAILDTINRHYDQSLKSSHACPQSQLVGDGGSPQPRA